VEIAQKLSESIKTMKPGTTITLDIWREGKMKTYSIKLGNAP